MAALAYQTSDFAYQGAGLFAYQDAAGDAPVVVDIPSVGNWNQLLRRKRKPIRIRYSDFDAQEKYAAALAAAAMPIARVTDTSARISPHAEVIDGGDSEDDDLIIRTVLLGIFSD